MKGIRRRLANENLSEMNKIGLELFKDFFTIVNVAPHKRVTSNSMNSA